MKKTIAILAALLLLTGCQSKQPTVEQAPAKQEEEKTEGVLITLSEEGVNVQGDEDGAVYTANDIIYYPEGEDFTFGEGTEEDTHEAAEAEAHTVVHITKPGTYTLTGTLPAGQIAVDLGDDAKDDPNAVVTLVLDNADITCSVAPAVIFYNVYECGDKDDPTKDVDTSEAGANVVLAEGSVNHVSGSHVAKIYKDGTQVLSEDGTEVEDAKKLHKYDAAFYSKMSMNVDGEGELHITAENEGLDSELHLTINGGAIYIRSGNDGINTNEDGVSVTTINGGLVDIVVTGETGEGDGIDSNGWLVINGGEVRASACATSQDAGIDSDMGIHVNGGTVMAAGHMLDRIEAGEQTYAVFSFTEPQQGGEEYIIKDAEGKEVLTASPENAFSVLIVASPDLTEGEYSLYRGDMQLSVAQGGGMMPPDGMERPEGERPELPEGMPEPSEGMTPPEGERPELPEGMPEPPEGMTPPEGELPEGMTPPAGGFGGQHPMERLDIGEAAPVFTLKKGENYFIVVQ